MIAAASIMGCSKIAQSFEMILIGRFMCGISAGVCVPLHHQYVGEISPRKLRGFGNSTSSFFWALGKAVGQISGQRELLGSQSLWPMLMASCGLPALVQLVTLPFFPESPPYLLMHKGDQEGCKKAIRQLWGEGHHQAEIDDIMKEKATMKNTKILSVLELMREPAFRWQLYMIVILTATVQLCGINAVEPPAFAIGAVLNWLGVFVIGTTFPFIVEMATFFSDLVQFQGLLQMILVLGIGGSFPYGFHISVINYPSVHIRKFINETWIERHGSPLHPETIMLLWSFIVSVYGIGGFLGSLCCGYLTTKYRKKKCQMCTNLIMLVAALFMAFSKTAKSFEMILVGRFLYGIGAGFALNIHPQYVGEISPKKLRGFTNSTVAVFLTLGKLTGQVIGLREILGREALWPWLLASSGLSALVQLVTLPFFPDSPSYLLIQKGNEEACRKAIRKLWGEGDHQAEIDDIMKEKAAMTSTKTLRVLEVIKERSLRWQLYILITVMTTLQLCGINAIYFYSFEVFHTAKFEEYLIPYVSLGVGLCECLSSILCSTLIDRFGRKVLLWGGYTLMCSVLALLTMTLSLQHQFFWMHYFSVILIFLFVIFYGTGPSGATISIMVEIFSQSFRPSAFLIVGCINWMGLFVLGMIFPLIVDNLGPFCFLIFLGILVLSAIFIYLYLPETKGKSIMEIKAEFNKLNFGKKETSVTENNFPKEQLFCTKL
ncbi:solute carrier family 2, facilitated glucose transporter member 11-like [Pterocles gutturalis]